MLTPCTYPQDIENMDYESGEPGMKLDSEGETKSLDSFIHL